MGMFSGIFGGGGEKPDDKPRNEGENFIAIPPDQKLGTTEDEGAAAEQTRERKEFLERMLENIESDPTHPDRENGKYEEYKEEYRELTK